LRYSRNSGSGSLSAIGLKNKECKIFEEKITERSNDDSPGTRRSNDSDESRRMERSTARTDRPLNVPGPGSHRSSNLSNMRDRMLGLSNLAIPPRHDRNVVVPNMIVSPVLRTRDVTM
jgi:hypothetical protein